MNHLLHRSSLALVACFAAVPLMPLHAAPPKSAAFVFVGDGQPGTPASDPLDPASWSGGLLPTETDDVVVNDLFHHKGPAGLVRMKSLRNEPGAHAYFQRASLSVAGDVTLDSTLEFQRGEATLTVGGSLFLEKGDLSFVEGLAKGKKGEPAPRFTAKSLDVGPDGRLRLRWFKDVPEGFPGNSVPYIRLSGDAIFASGSLLRIQFENVENAGGLYPGEYLLLTAGGAVKGSLPKLEIVGAPDGDKLKSELKFSPDKRKLMLVVTAVR